MGTMTSIRRKDAVTRSSMVAAVACLALAAVPSAASAADRDCPEFATQGAAQTWLGSHPGDPDGLDADHDGTACVISTR